MFSVKVKNFAGAMAFLLLASLVGCRTSEKKPQSVTPKTSPPVEAAQPQPAPVHVPNPADSGDSMAPNILAWDTVSEVRQAKAGESKVPFTFHFKNVSSRPVVIYDTATTCDCTVANLSSKPWTIPSGGAGKIDATIDVSGKTGAVTNSIVVFTSKGNRRLWVEAHTVK